MNSAPSVAHSSFYSSMVTSASLEEGELPPSSPLLHDLGRTMNDFNTLFGITPGWRPGTVVQEPWRHPRMTSVQADHVPLTVQPSKIVDPNEAGHPVALEAPQESGHPAPSAPAIPVPQPPVDTFGKTQSHNLQTGSRSDPLSVSTSNIAPSADESMPASAEESLADTQSKAADQAGYESSVSADSERPVALGARRRQIKNRSSHLSNTKATRTSTANATEDSPAIIALKSEGRQIAAGEPKTQLTAKRFGDQARYQLSVDWVDKCDRCIEENVKCYTAAGSTYLSRACHNCFVRHWTCTVGGERVYKKQAPNPRQRKRKATVESLADTSTSSKQLMRRPRTGKVQPRKSGRASKAAQHNPVLLTQASQQPQHSKRTRVRKQAAKKSLMQNAGPVEEGSDISSAPESDDEPLANTFNNRPAELPDTSSSSASFTRDDDGILQTEEAQTGIAQEHVAIVVDAGQNESDESIPGNVSLFVEAAEPATKRLPEPRMTQYVLGLINDIEGTIRRCQGSMPQIQDYKFKLGLLEKACEVLVWDLAKVLVPDNTDFDGSKPEYWILPELKDYLQGILLECQHARETPNGQELDASEKLGRQIVAMAKSETLFDRCLTLISMHVRKEST